MDAHELAAIIRDTVAKEVAKATAALREALEMRIDAIPRPADGKSVSLEEVRDLVRLAVEAIPKPQNGKDVEPSAIEAMVARAVGALPRAENGKDADPEQIRQTVAAEVARAVAALPRPEPGQKGKDADMVAISGEIVRTVAAAVGSLPKPAEVDQKAIAADVLDRVTAIAKVQIEAMRPSDGVDGPSKEEVADLVRSAVAVIPPPKDGKSVDVAEVAAMVAEQVRAAVAALPAPKPGENGKSVDLTEVRAQIAAEIREGLARIPAPVNGKDFDPAVLRAEVDRAVAALPAAKPGDPGKSVTVDDVRPILEGEVAKAALDFERRATDTLARVIEKMPKPKDGVDGFDLDDFSASMKDDRTIELVFAAEGHEKRFELRFPVLLDGGTFKAGQTYLKGDCPTYGGSMFVAQRDTLPTERPEDGSGAFRLAVKRGRDAAPAT